MSNPISLSNSCILLAGSISLTTNDDQIDKAHSFVEALVTEVINAGGSLKNKRTNSRDRKQNLS